MRECRQAGRVRSRPTHRQGLGCNSLRKRLFFICVGGLNLEQVVGVPQEGHSGLEEYIRAK